MSAREDYPFVADRERFDIAQGWAAAEQFTMALDEIDRLRKSQCKWENCTRPCYDDGSCERHFWNGEHVDARTCPEPVFADNPPRIVGSCGRPSPCDRHDYDLNDPEQVAAAQAIMRGEETIARKS